MSYNPLPTGTAGTPNTAVLTVQGISGATAVKTDGSGVTQPVSVASTTFAFSSVNTTTVQLAAGAAFTGAVENVLNQTALSINLTCDQPYTLTVNQFIDAAGLSLISTWSVTQSGPMNQAWLLNGNYVQVVLKNNGTSATTTLNLNTAYGTIDPSTQLGNLKTALVEIAGTPLSSGTLPVAVSNLPTTQAVSNQSLYEQNLNILAELRTISRLLQVGLSINDQPEDVRADILNTLQ